MFNKQKAAEGSFSIHCDNFTSPVNEEEKLLLDMSFVEIG